MDTSYLISIIIPIYNRAHIITDAVNSVIAAERNDVQIILIDDCSTDNTFDVCNELATNNAHIILTRLQKNLGPGGARNVGINLAQGEFVFFLDSDDTVVTSNFIECLNLIQLNNTVDIFSFQAFCHFGKDTQDITNGAVEGYYHGEAFSQIFLQHFSYGCVWLYVFRISFLRKKHITFPQEFLGEDVQFVHQAIFHADNFYVSHKYIYNFIPYDKHKWSPNELFQAELTNFKNLYLLLNNSSPVSFAKRANFETLLETHYIDIIRFGKELNVSSNDSWRIISQFWVPIFEQLKTCKSICLTPFGRYSKILYDNLSSVGIKIDRFYDNNPDGLYRNCPIVETKNISTQKPELIVIISTLRVVNAVKAQIEDMGYEAKMYGHLIGILTRRACDVIM